MSRYDAERPHCPNPNAVDYPWCTSCIQNLLQNPMFTTTHGGCECPQRTVDSQGHPIVVPLWHPQLRDALRRLSASKVQLLQLIAYANHQFNDPSRAALVKDIKCRIIVHKMRVVSFLGLDNAMGEITTRFVVWPDGSSGVVTELDWEGGHIKVQLDMPDGSLLLP